MRVALYLCGCGERAAGGSVMAKSESSIPTGSFEVAPADGKPTSLREDLQMQIDRLLGSNDMATTGEIAPALVAIQAILDDFDARLQAIEAKGGGTDYSKAENSGNHAALAV